MSRQRRISAYPLQWSPSQWLGVLLVGGAGSALAFGAAGAAGAATGSTSASARPVPTLAPNAIDAPPLASVSLPTARSEPPKRDEWAAATMVAVVQKSSAARACDAFVLRDYMRVRCPQAMAAVRQYTGAIKDVSVFVTPKERDADGSFHLLEAPLGGDVVFPLRKGESFLFQFFTVEEGYDGFGAGPGVIVDVSWPTSREVPTVVLR